MNSGLLATVVVANLLNFSIKDVHVLETVLHFGSTSIPLSIGILSMSNILPLSLMAVNVICISIRHF